jgi:hypothetical protein
VDFSSDKTLLAIINKITQQNSMDEIERERKILNNRMAGYKILQIINFMSELNL